MAGYTFSQRSAQRIKDTTIQVERWVQNDPPPTKARANNLRAGFWAKITGGENGKYSFIGQKPNDEGKLEDDEAWGKGDHEKDEGYAVELRNKSKHIPNDSIVWLMPAKGQRYYHFEYNPGILVARLPAEAVITSRQDFGAAPRPGSGMVELLKVNDGANPDTVLDDEFEATGIMVRVFNWTKTAVGSSEAKPVLIEFGTSGRFWIVGDEC